MRRAISKVILSILVAASFCVPAVVLASSGKRLVTINEVEYTNEDFKNWWRHWNTKNEMKFPASPDDFINFQLMVQQGLEMGYDTQPGFLRKLDVFLQVRALMSLKYEEVDSKAAVTDEDLKKYFDENYGTVWVLQILAFDSEDKAQKAYDLMLPLQWQTPGRLVFADMAGGDSEDKADTYDEVSLTVFDFHKNKKDTWLEIVRKLGAGEVAKPFLNKDDIKYILMRLVEIKPAAEGVFEEKRKAMHDVINKEKRNQLTLKLIENLKGKYNVRLDEELLNSIEVGIEYPQEFLGKVVVSMTDFKATVYDVIYNVLKEKRLRKDVSDQYLKESVANTIISQTLINKESLARGYEKRPPLLWTYEFYKQNRLRLEVEAGLMNSIAFTDQELQDYYNLNIADFSIAEKVTFFLLKGGEDVLKKIWLGTLSGENLTELAEKYSVDVNMQSQDVVSLAPEIVKELKQLDKGQVGMPFVLDGSYALLKLHDRLPGQVSTFEQVKVQVNEQLKKKKFEVAKSEYLNKLKSRSKIDLNEGVWNDLERELGNGKKD